MKPSVLAACLVVALALPAQAKDRALPFKPVTGAFLALSVPNLPASVQWYSEKLGLAVVMEVPGTPAVTVLEGGGLIVELVHDPAARPRPARPDLVHGPFKAGFLVKDFGPAVEELRRRGVEIAFGPYPANGAQRANAIIRDNAGNLIQLFGD